MYDENGLYADNGGRPVVTQWSNHRVDVFNVQREDIDVERIAHSLSRLCRYNGHCKGYISVARHCTWVAHMTLVETNDMRLAHAALLHDAAESFIGDLVRPLKMHPEFKEYELIEKEIDYVVANVFDVPWPLPPVIKDIDNLASVLELTYRLNSWTSTPDEDKEAFLAWHRAISYARIKSKEFENSTPPDESS